TPQRRQGLQGVRGVLVVIHHEHPEGTKGNGRHGNPCSRAKEKERSQGARRFVPFRVPPETEVPDPKGRAAADHRRFTPGKIRRGTRVGERDEWLNAWPPIPLSSNRLRQSGLWAKAVGHVRWCQDISATTGRSILRRNQPLAHEQWLVKDARQIFPKILQFPGTLPPPKLC